METTLILSALAVLALSGVMVATMVARSRRPELRMGREEDLAEDGEESLIRSIVPPRPSPIDRSATILEIEPTRSEPARIEPAKIEPARIEPGSQRETQRRLPDGEGR